ncbi:MAG TPA: BREX system Lon protease-like protein BrxL [Leptospiraceae bacterium]|nr:BREX system Lon protease-like protein BrxL [Leptospiraceae bacterium]
MTIFDKIDNNLLTEKKEASYISNLYKGIPRYVIEYLITKQKKQKTKPENFIDEISKYLKKIPEINTIEKIRHDLQSNGEVVIVDQVQVKVSRKAFQKDVRYASLLNFNEKSCLIENDLLEKFKDDLLRGTGLWSLVTLGVDKSNNYLIQDIEPLQTTLPDISEFKKIREKFNSDEWIDLLITSIGFEPKSIGDRKDKLLILSRLVPLVEESINQIEFGPKATGKTTIFTQISPYAHTQSAGKISRAAYFYHAGTQEPGLVQKFDLIVIDEVGQARFEPELIGLMKQYLEQGEFAVGKYKKNATAGFVFLANIPVKNFEIDFDNLGSRNVFQPLPQELRVESAFIDRFNSLIPGWKIKPIENHHILESEQYGFTLNYLSEIFHLLRTNKEPFKYLETNVKFPNQYLRSVKAVHRFTSGLIKLIYPHLQLDKDELNELLDISIGYRQAVMDGLSRIDREFREKPLIQYVGMKNPKHIFNYTAIDSEDVHNHSFRLGEVTGLLVGQEKGQGFTAIIEAKWADGKREPEVTNPIAGFAKEALKNAYHVIQEKGKDLDFDLSFLKSKHFRINFNDDCDSNIDGTSCGFAYIIVMASLLSNRKVKPGLAVTGAITLNGKSQSIGGLDEKAIAAHAKGRKKLLLPKENEQDYNNLPSELRAEITPIYINNVFKLIEEALE